jgi:MYXO-CTERM domain-containing protein
VVASCSFADQKVSCGEAFCSEGVKGKAPVCDGEGLCAPSETTACKSFTCNGTECSTACTSNADCVKELECREGECKPPLKIAAVDEGSCGCSLPGSHSGAPAGVLCLLGLCAAAVLRRRRQAA